MTSPSPVGTILVVDDDAAVRSLFEVVLERRGHRVFGASTIWEALTAFEKRRADLVLVDMFMPTGSGLELIRTLRAMNPPPRIIAITGGGVWDGFDVLQRAESAGADLALRKPLTSETLVAEVERLLPPTP